jgi:hypothetical protein
MTLQKKLIVSLIATFLIIDFAIIYHNNYSLDSLSERDTYIVLTLIPLFFIFISFAFSVLVSSLIKGQLIKIYFLKFFLITLIPSLLFGLYYVFNGGFNNKNAYRIFNKEHNEKYKIFYNDSRDENINLAIRALENSTTDNGELRIKRMRVIEKDTIENGVNKKFYDIHQIYCLGRNSYINNTFASRYLIIDKKVTELFYNESIKLGIGYNENKICDSLLKLTLTNQTKDSIIQNSENNILDVVKLKK